MKKKIALLTLIALMTVCLAPVSAHAETQDPQTEITVFDDGSYLVTTIRDAEEGEIDGSGISLFNTRTITKTKTTEFKNEAGTTLWYVAITATFSFDLITSECLSCSHRAAAPAKTWTIKSSSHHKGIGSATAKCTATHSFGVMSEDFTEYVTIRCSKTGAIS